MMPAKRPLPASIVLIVEDDELVRFSAVMMLEDAGFTVIGAVNADEAWDILCAHHDVGVLFTDIDMLGSMCGRKTAERVFRSWPEIRLILTSGSQRFREEEVPDHGLFVAKPYTTCEVVNAIHGAS
ncbi:response regulator [Methylobacterium sp. E-025]|uniref:response regulator n=1 Tax=Methylobacterium sp. E-025 TaxID=2836561 RepID=UPI0028BEE279|nr:response regulator [Methylobacterium sp. E-025]